MAVCQQQLMLPLTVLIAILNTGKGRVILPCSASATVTSIEIFKDYELKGGYIAENRINVATSFIRYSYASGRYRNIHT